MTQIEKVAYAVARSSDRVRRAQKKLREARADHNARIAELAQRAKKGGSR